MKKSTHPTRLLYLCCPLLVLFLITAPLAAQNGLSGLWEGTITEGGLHSEKSYPLELRLEIKGQYIHGVSYIYIRSDSVVYQKLSGKMHQDRSISLKEVKVGEFGSESPFTRKYQLIYNRSIWESSVEGYWQEIIPTPFDYRRDRGQVKLKKKKEAGGA